MGIDLKTNGASTKDPATALFERKLALGAELQCRDLLADLERADDELVTALGQKAVYEQDILHHRASIEDAETLACLAVEGKNDAERRARKIQALREDGAYREKLDALHHEQSDAARLEVEIKRIERRQRRIERAIEYRTSVLRCLGG